MAITAILNQLKDSRRGGSDCAFNGYLEDWLEEETDPVLKKAFTAISESDPEAKICIGLRSSISREAISNQIIRYKDVYKLGDKPLEVPYILYEARNEEERGLLVVPYSKYSYLFAKGYYYCLSEPGAPFIDCRNEMVAIASSQPQEIADAWNELFKKRAGVLQREIDQKHYHDYEELKTDALLAAEEQKAEAYQLLPEMTDRTEVIRHYVVNWFLLKKVLYVQYMVNKHILNEVHQGNIRKQRNQAKINADEIGFLSYSEMWRTNGAPGIKKETSEE